MQEFVDFLSSQPPFDQLGANDLKLLARRIKVNYWPAGTELVAAGSEVLDRMWVIRRGQVEVLDRGRVIDVLTVGDTFGHASMLSGQRPAVSIRAVDEVLLYELPDPRPLLARADPLQFRNSVSLSWRQGLVRPSVLATGQTSVERLMRPIVWCLPQETVRDAASKITGADTSCVMVQTSRGVGIATDRDFRSQVATGRTGLDSLIGDMVCVPTLSVSSKATVASALLRMVETGVHHLAVTNDQNRIVGVVRAIDLGSLDVRDPLMVRAAIESATDIADLAKAGAMLTPTLTELVDDGVPVLRAGALMSAMVEAILLRLLQLNRDIGFGTIETSWLVLGSLARREPLPASDVDTAVMWSSAHDNNDQDANRIRDGARVVLSEMETCGLDRCPNGANADNPLFSRSRSQWQRSARRWIEDPTLQGALLLSSIMADSRPITRVLLGREITDTIRVTTQSLAFREAMLRFTVAKRPPVGFVREFVVEHGGDHRGGLDLKAGGLSPIAALARWLALVLGDVSGGTVERLRRAQEAGLLTGGEADATVGAFQDIYSLAFEREIARLRTGEPASTWVAPDQLDALARRHLRESFRAVSQVQATVSAHWRQRIRL